MGSFAGANGANGKGGEGKSKRRRVWKPGILLKHIFRGGECSINVSHPKVTVMGTQGV